VPNGNVGAPYNATVNATGGFQPYNWTITSGSLPPGLIFNNNNNSVNISGTPTTVGSYLFTFQVTDNQAATASAGFAISISAGAPLSIQTTSLPGGNNGWAYSTFVKATGGSGNYTWSVISGNLPAGLSFDPNNSGNISGTPTATGTASFTVQVADTETPPSTATTALSIAITSCTFTGLNGHYAFLANGWKGATDATSAVGSFVADGAGHLTVGNLDVSEQSKGTTSGTFTGTYCVGPNNLAAINLTLAAPFNGSALFAAALDSTGNGHVVSYDNSSSAIVSGLLRKESTSAFSTSSINGNYAFGLVGADQNARRLCLGWGIPLQRQRRPYRPG